MSDDALQDEPFRDDLEPVAGLVQKVRRDWQPVEWSGVNVGVALSGGADSVSLLRALRQLKQEVGGLGKLVALHVNHQLRGKDSEEDAAWCGEQCEALGVPLEVLRCDTAQSAVETGEGIEAAARVGRYRLLTEAAEGLGVRYLATAHTLDDQVETVLFRVLRGTGLRGLSGIPRTRVLTPSLTLIRPLLACSRETVLNYLTGVGQSYRTDLSNDDRQFTRNRLRHELLPLLREQYNSELDRALVRLSEQAGAGQHFVELSARRLLDAARFLAKPQGLVLGWKVFAGQERLIVCEALRIAWRDAGLAEQAMSYSWWNRLASLVEHPREGAVLNLPGSVRASIAGDRLLLEW